jgi:hypothetical protein
MPTRSRTSNAAGQDDVDVMLYVVARHSHVLGETITHQSRTQAKVIFIYMLEGYLQRPYSSYFT